MKKFSLGLLLFFGITTPFMAQSDVSKSKWRSKEIVIDGIADDWNQPLNFYDDKTGLSYAISNDRHDLYLIFSSPDEMKMRKIISAGWSIQLISKEKRRKLKARITFPGIKMNWIGERRADNPLSKKIGESPYINNYKAQIVTLEARGFRSNLQELKLGDRKSINIAIGADNLQHIIYEIAIPLKELFNEKEIHLDELITLDINVTAMERPSSGGGYGYSESGNARLTNALSGKGGRSGGGMSHGRSYSGNSSGNKSGLFEDASFKQKFTLAGSL